MKDMCFEVYAFATLFFKNEVYVLGGRIVIYKNFIDKYNNIR